MSTLRDSRVTVPRLPPRYVSRPRLLTGLDGAADLPLTLLCAGPGAGKTVLLADWVRRANARVAWLSPTAADGEPRRFWRLLESALPGCDGSELGSPVGTTLNPGLDLVQMLFSQVPESAEQLVVIIDDAHVIRDPEVLNSLDRLIRGRQPGLRLILAARSDPLLPLHRYRLAGQMLELRAADLAMTPTEVGQVLAAHGVSLPKPDFDVLVARTEGWAAGVRLSAMRMEGTEQPTAFVSQLALDPGSIGEYLVDEVLGRLPGPYRRLLIETSFLDEVAGPLADAVTGMAGCGDMLADLARDNSFVIPLDPLQTRYRYHQLFGEILRYLLQRHDGEAVCALMQRAAAWFEANDDLGSAVHWAVQAGDGPRVAALLARGGLADALVHRQDLSGVGLRELMPLIRDQNAENPDTAFSDTDAGRPEETIIAGSVVAAIFADSDAAAGELERLEAWQPTQAPTDPDLLASCDLVRLILGQKAFDIDAVDAAAGRLLGKNDDGDAKPLSIPGLRAAVLLAQASAHMWHGRHEDVGALLDEALAETRRDGSDILELEALGMIAFVDSFWSRTNHADKAAERAHALRKQKGLSMPSTLELAVLIRAAIGGDLAVQARTLQRIMLPDVVGADPGLTPALALGHASALLAHGQEAEARAILHEQADRRIPPLLALHRDILLADLDTSLGRPRSALALLERYRSTEFATVTATARARAHLALSDPRAARDCVRSVLTTPSAQTGRLVLVDAMLCDALIAQLRGDLGRALEILIRAIELAQGEIILPFLGVKDAFNGLLARHPDVAARWPVPLPDTSPELLSIPAQRRPPRELPEPLTQRELTILRFLATSMSTVEIADELCLSVNTVKTHLAAIYRKLPANRRRDAVLRARELELI
jgi:LuxR family maltose regulon positive regulatory protein